MCCLDRRDPDAGLHVYVYDSRQPALLIPPSSLIQATRIHRREPGPSVIVISTIHGPGSVKQQR